ncbi:hypothetical protein [Microbulbifer taiwanensis]|uniref:Dienelactone hydrolase n=1 Tax=Microbulbifer taiwanensis TaxID=986746 RepID=A0ABW1YIV6_9GAMM|nr:hypothetical protein [Microbulbifer taiwanensis]
MLLNDFILIAALLLFVMAWWLPALPRRAAILLGMAATALAAGLYGVWTDRWQAAVGAAIAVIFLIAQIASRKSIDGGRPIPFISGSLFALLAAIAITALFLFPVGNLPAPSGDYAVGVREFELRDHDRPGLLSAGDGEPRRLLVRIWYPASPSEEAVPVSYFSAGEAATTATGVGSLAGFPPFLTYLRHVGTNAYKDAPLHRDFSEPGSGRLPPIFYSHGYTTFAGQNSALMEELASHGYAVYAIQHSYDSSPTVFPNGDILPMDPELVTFMAGMSLSEAAVAALAGATLDEQLQGQIENRRQMLASGDRLASVSAGIWLQDRRFVLDRLQAGQTPESVAEIAAASNFTRTGQMGMSFGGSTTGALCTIDSRCAAGINLDGADYHQSAFNTTVPVPFIMFHSDLENFYRQVGVADPRQLRSYNALSYESFDDAGSRDDIYRLQLRGSTHMGITDFSLFMGSPIRELLTGTAPAEILIGSQNDFVRGFFDRHLRGLDNGFPQKQLEEYRGWVMPVDNTEVRNWWLAKPAEEREAIERRIEALKGAGPTSIAAQ